MAKLRKRYTKVEKLEIVSLSLEEGQKVSEIALQYGLNANTIYNWRSAYAKHPEKAFPGKGNKAMDAQERKIFLLEKQLKESQLECEILKKAVGIFSKSDKKFSNL